MVTLCGFTPLLGLQTDLCRLHTSEFSRSMIKIGGFATAIFQAETTEFFRSQTLPFNQTVLMGQSNFQNKVQQSYEFTYFITLCCTLAIAKAMIGANQFEEGRFGKIWHNGYYGKLFLRSARSVILSDLNPIHPTIFTYHAYIAHACMVGKYYGMN